jgi:hypothetical protein
MRRTLENPLANATSVDRQACIGEQALRQKQAMRLRIPDRGDAELLQEYAPQMAIGDADPPRHDVTRSTSVADAVFNHACCRPRQFRARFGRPRIREPVRDGSAGRDGTPPPPPPPRSDGRNSSPASAAGHATDRTAIHTRRRHADEEASVEARVVRFQGLIAGTRE